MPDARSGVNGNCTTANPCVGAATDADVEIITICLDRAGRDLLYVDAQVTSGPYRGQALQEMYRLDPTSDHARGRLLSFALATGLGRAAGFRASDLVGRRMIVEANGTGGWCRERPLYSPVATTPRAVAGALAITRTDVRDAFRTYLLIEDDAIIEAPLAVRIAHDFVDAEALALVTVGPSSSGKTEITVAIGGSHKGYPISDLTSRTLVSGWRYSAGNASLINRLKDNVLCIKDLTSILSGRADERAKILGQLRELLDGSYERDWGNGEHLDWAGKLSIIGACTPIIDQHHEAIAQLGTRFLYVRTAIADATAIAKAAMERGGASKQARAHAAQVVKDFVAQFAPVALAGIALSDEHRDELARWAVFLATARAPVPRDPYRRDIIETPVVEGPARAVKQLHMIAAARARLEGRAVISSQDVALARRIAWDSVPSLRARVLAAVLETPGAIVEQVEADVQPGAATPIRRALEDLYVLGLVRREGSKAHRYSAGEQLEDIAPGVPGKPSE